jgi:hypothetical protein
MGNVNNNKGTSTEKRQLIERIERLEIGLILIVNQLRSLKEFPPKLLKTVEKIILNKGEE